MTVMSSGDTKGYSIRIPPEILAGILSRLSVKSLCRLKCVSPSWNSLISSPYFAKTHLKRTSINSNPRPKIILVSDSQDLYSVDNAGANPSAKKIYFPSAQHSPKRVKVLGSCNGLLLVSDKGYSTFLLNPTTGKRGLVFRIGSKVIVAFNLSDEIFREVELPTLFNNCDSLYLHMAVLGDCLCVLVCPLNYRNEVWMMKEYGVRESWTKFMINPGMDFLCLLAEDEYLMKTRGKVLDVLFQEKLVVYNPKKETLRDMVVPGIPPKCQHGISYVESLVSPNN